MKLFIGCKRIDAVFELRRRLKQGKQALTLRFELSCVLKRL